MIRDFAGIKKKTLNEEIIALREGVEDGSADRAITPETVDAIDHVRGVGNIGAHMEKDINLIVDVDPGEAQALIELTEMLFEEWYAARENRKTKLARIAGIAEQKRAARSLPRSGQDVAEANAEAEQNVATDEVQAKALVDLLALREKAPEQPD